MSMGTQSNLTETYLAALIAGDTSALSAGFAGEPAVYDPLDGDIKGTAAFERFLVERKAWLAQRGAQLEPVRTTRNDQRTVFEALLHLHLPEKPEKGVEVPIAVVGEHAANGQVSAIRVYHSLWPLFGSHRVRPPLLPLDPNAHVTDVIAKYQAALARDNTDAIVNTFEPDGYFREPAGGEYIYRGHAQLHDFMKSLLDSGGIILEHCTITDDGVACAIEFNAVKFGPHALEPQAGVAVYERGASGLLHGARVYDDVNVEAMAT
jgi:SnoaL-like domain